MKSCGNIEMADHGHFCQITRLGDRFLLTNFTCVAQCRTSDQLRVTPSSIPQLSAPRTAVDSYQPSSSHFSSNHALYIPYL